MWILFSWHCQTQNPQLILLYLLFMVCKGPGNVQSTLSWCLSCCNATENTVTYRMFVSFFLKLHNLKIFESKDLISKELEVGLLVLFKLNIKNTIKAVRCKNKPYIYTTQDLLTKWILLYNFSTFKTTFKTFWLWCNNQSKSECQKLSLSAIAVWYNKCRP